MKVISIFNPISGKSILIYSFIICILHFYYSYSNSFLILKCSNKYLSTLRRQYKFQLSKLGPLPRIRKWPILCNQQPEIASDNIPSSTDIEVKMSDLLVNADKIIDDEDMESKAEAMYLLDCLTSPKDVDDPLYDMEKDIERMDLLRMNDYESLKVELRARGLRTSGDKTEMMIRLLLSIIEPTMQYSESSGTEPNVQYIDEEDIKSQKARIIPLEERSLQLELDGGPDAEDLIVLKKRRKIISSSGDNIEFQKRADDKQKIMMDGMIRKEVGMETFHSRRDEFTAKKQDLDVKIRGYVVGSKDVLKTWRKHSPIVILLPDIEHGWRSKEARILADEIAFFHASIVLIPDIFRGQTSLLGESKTLFIQRLKDRIFDDVIASLYYLVQEYDSKSISLSGFGLGGGRALEIACDLSDISAYAQVRYATFDKGSDKYYSNPYDSLPSRSLILTGELEDSEVLFNQTSNSTSTSDDNKVTVSAPLKSAIDYSEEDVLIRKQNSSALQWKSAENVVKLKLIQQVPHLTIATIAKFCPKSLCIFSPEEFNLERIASDLQIPLFLALHNESISLKIPNTLYDEFERRRNEIIDYCIRCYELASKSTFINPISDDEGKCAQDARIIGSFWLDIYSRATNIDDMVDGVGTTKLSPYDSLRLITKKDLRDLSSHGSPIATYLHDEGNLFENDRLESDEAAFYKTQTNIV